MAAKTDSPDEPVQSFVHSPGPWIAVIGRTDNHGKKVFEVRDANHESVTGWGAVQQTAGNAMMIAKAIEFRDALQCLLSHTNPLVEQDEIELCRARSKAQKLIDATKPVV